MTHSCWFEVGGAPSEKGDVIYFCPPIGIQHHQLSATRSLSVEIRPIFIDLMTQLVKTEELIKDGRVVTSQNLTVGPDCGAGCVEVDAWRNTSTQHIYVVWHTSETRLTTDFSLWMIIFWSNEAGPTDFQHQDFSYTTNRSFSYTNLRKGTSCG